MKANNLITLAAAVCFISACKEKGPAIDFGNTPVAKDTTYVTTSIPMAQKRCVLIEDFTGGKCSNCPAARQLIDNIASQHPGQIFPVEIHMFHNNSTTQPVKGSKHDFRTQDGTDLNTVFYAASAIPAIGINRVPVGNQMIVDRLKWAGAVQEQLNNDPVVNLTVESDYNDADKTAAIRVTAIYIKPISGRQYLTLAILEDNIVDFQDFPDSTDHNYTFKHTLRDIVTSVTGEEFLKDMPDKEPGRVYERTFIYPVNSEWKPENCKVVAFVHNNDADNKEILQAAETKLKE